MRDGKNSIRLKLNFLQNYLHITIGSNQKFAKFNRTLLHRNLSNYTLTSSVFNHSFNKTIKK